VHQIPSNWRRQARELWAACRQFVFARACVACGQEPVDRPLCAGCEHRLERRLPPWCERCGEPLLPGQPCPDDHRILAGIALHRAPLRYRGTGADLVHRFKFGHDLATGHHLARGMAHAIGAWARTAGRRSIVVAVPRHARKLRQARFDPADWLARLVAERTALPVRHRLLVRTRPTLPQADPRVVSREANVAGAFACPSPRELRERTVLLVDDVLTSGATARACAAELRRAGARFVAVLTAARA